jgi:hypothetical protein
MLKFAKNPMNVFTCATNQGPQTFLLSPMKTIQMTLDTKLDEFMKLSLEELTERKQLIEEYIELVVTNVENHPADFANNRLRRTEVCSMRTLSEIFQHRIEELRNEKHMKNVA